MSRGFTKEDDSLPPVVVPPRAPLPAGVANYVTPRGLQLLRAELTEIEAERARLDANSAAIDAQTRTQQLLVLNGRISALTSRLTSAKVVALATQLPTEARFGVTVVLRVSTGLNAGQERRFTIVGVDEADASQGLVAFTAPVARAVIGKRVGTVVQLPTADGPEAAVIKTLTYETTE